MDKKHLALLKKEYDILAAIYKTKRSFEKEGSRPFYLYHSLELYFVEMSQTVHVALNPDGFIPNIKKLDEEIADLQQQIRDKKTVIAELDRAIEKGKT